MPGRLSLCFLLPGQTCPHPQILFAGQIADTHRTDRAWGANNSGPMFELVLQIYDGQLRRNIYAAVRSGICGRTPHLWPLCTYGRHENYFPLQPHKKWAKKKKEIKREASSFAQSIFRKSFWLGAREYRRYRMKYVCIYTHMCCSHVYLLGAQFFNLKWGWKEQSYSFAWCVNMLVHWSVLKLCAHFHSVHLLNSTFGATLLQPSLRQVQ